jgi:hypothetical protein
LATESDERGAEGTISLATLRPMCGKAGLGEAVAVEPLPGGRNNRVFLLETRDQRVLAKVYFRDGRRDRLKREFEFLQYLAWLGVGRVPRPLCADHELQVGLYEFVEGKKLDIEEITEGDIDQAIDFFRALNLGRGNERAQRLEPAAEACFSMAEHLESVDRRVAPLQEIETTGDVGPEARAFVQQELVPLWRVLRRNVADECERAGLLEAELPPTSRFLSPSDFGYHNALREPSGRIRFLDFEYAGWDDPAKLACDFANQPDMLLPPALSGRFRAAVMEDDQSPWLVRKRVGWLMPVYQLKWSCIILNEFLPQGRRRSRFVSDETDAGQRKQEQLAKARRMLERATTSMQAPA